MSIVSHYLLRNKNDIFLFKKPRFDLFQILVFRFKILQDMVL